MYPDLATALDSNADSQAILALVDMTAAFDAVNHSILLQRLQQRDSARIRLTTTSVYSVRRGLSRNSRETWAEFTFLCGRCPTVPYLSSIWLCHMRQWRFRLRRRNWPVDGGTSFGNETGEDWCLVVFHKSPTFRFTTYTAGEMRNLGVVFDGDLSLKAHISQLRGRCYSCLRHIKSCLHQATSQSNGNGQNLSTHKIQTP